MRTNEYLYILQKNLGKDLKIEAFETESSEGTFRYEIVAYHKSDLIDELPKDRLKEYLEDGIVAVLDFVYVSEDLDEALRHLMEEYELL